MFITHGKIRYREVLGFFQQFFNQSSIIPINTKEFSSIIRRNNHISRTHRNTKRSLTMNNLPQIPVKIFRHTRRIKPNKTDITTPTKNKTTIKKISTTIKTSQQSNPSERFLIPNTDSPITRSTINIFIINKDRAYGIFMPFKRGYFFKCSLIPNLNILIVG